MASKAKKKADLTDEGKRNLERDANRRAVLERAAFNTAPAAGKAAVGRVARGVAALGPKMIRQLQADGTLSRNARTMLRQIAGGVEELDREMGQRRAAEEAEDRRIYEAAQRATDAEVHELVLAARRDPVAAEQLARLEGALWRENLRRPEFVQKIVTQHGEAGARKYLAAFKVEHLAGLAEHTHVNAKADDFARAAQDAQFEAGGLRDDPLSKDLRDPAFQRGAYLALRKLGKKWEGHKTPGDAVHALVLEAAERGGDASEIAKAVADEARGLLGTPDVAAKVLARAREAAVEKGLRERMAERDREAAARRSKPPEDPDVNVRAEREANRRAILSKAYDAATPRHMVNPATGETEDIGTDYDRFSVDRVDSRKAAMIGEYQRQTGRKVVLDIQPEPERDLARQGDVLRDRLSAAYDHLSGETPSPSPSAPQQSWRESVEAAYDDMAAGATP